MITSKLGVDIKLKAGRRKVIVELDAQRFERLAAHLGLFSNEFISSLEQSEREAKQGKLIRLRSLKDLRKE